MNRPKYGATRCEVNGIAFDSLLEARRWGQLETMERGGLISTLTRQQKYALKVGEVVLGYYVADFVYWLPGQTEPTIEDAKGMVTPLCRWKLKHMAAQGNPVSLWPEPKKKTRKKKGKA